MPRPSNLSEEGEAYFAYLAERGISQRNFSIETGVSDSYLSLWANGGKGMSDRKVIERFPRELAITILTIRRDRLQREIDRL